MKKKLMGVMTVLCLVAALLLCTAGVVSAGAPPTLPAPSGASSWQLDSFDPDDTIATVPPPGTVYQMERNGGSGQDGQAGQVAILGNGGSAIWIADEVCNPICVFPSSGGSAAWKTEIASEAQWQGLGMAVRVGEWSMATGFRPFATMKLVGVSWSSWPPPIVWYQFELDRQLGNEQVAAGNYLAVEITNNDVVQHTVYTGQGDYASCLTSPQTGRYYVPEVPTIALLGVGLLGLVGIGYLGWRKHKATV